MLNAPFRFFISALVLATLASTMLSVAVGWHIYEATGNPFDLALVGLMQILPVIGLFIVTGWVLDNVQRKYILVACCVLQGVVLVGLGVALSADEFSRFAVFGLLLLNGVAGAFFLPAEHSMLPGLVEERDLARAVAISSTSWTAGGTAGPFVAGILIAWLDTDIYWLLATLTFLAAVLMACLPSVTMQRTRGRGIAQLLDGVHFVARNPLVLPSISLDLAIVLFGSVMALLPVFAVDILNVGPEALGLMRAMPALGAVIAGVALARIPELRNTGRQLFISLILFAISILVFAVSRNLWLSLAALFFYGATDMVSVNVRSTVIQLATPDEVRGRVNAVNSLFISTSNHMGDFRAGAVAAVLGPITTVLVGGVLAIGIAVGGYLVFPTLRKLDRMTEASHKATTD